MSLFSFFPPTFFRDGLKGRNGYNTALHIVIARGPLQAAVYAQELYEFWHKWIRLQVGMIFTGCRSMELMSHEIEIQAAAIHCGQDEAEYRKAEARRMMSYDWLYDLGEEEIERRMIQLRPKALKWVRKRRKLLERAARA